VRRNRRRGMLKSRIFNRFGSWTGFAFLLFSLLQPLSAAGQERAVAAGQERAVTGLQVALALEETLVGVIAQSEKSIVAIARVRAEAVGEEKPTHPDFVPTQYGTGVVIDGRGLILTTYELVNQEDSFWITTIDRKVYRARPKGADPRSGLAVLQVDSSELTPIQFGDASKLRKGQFVISLGNPYGIARDGQISASWGIVSNLSRKAGPVWSEFRQNDKPSLHHLGTLIQTDAKLNVGTSGGALVNLRGEMVGLVTAAAATAGFELSAGYAIPINDAFRRVVDTLKEGREVEYGLLGIVTEDLDQQAYVQGEHGMVVQSVVLGTPAAKIGLKAGDVITHVNGEKIYGADGLMLEVGKLPVESRVDLRVRRNGNTLAKSATLTKNYVRGKSIVTDPKDLWRGIRVDYATAIEDYQERLRRNEVDLDGCVVVKDVVLDSPAWKQGLRPNDFITQVAGIRVRKPSEFYAAVDNASGSVAVRTTDSQRPVRLIPEACSAAAGQRGRLLCLPAAAAHQTHDADWAIRLRRRLRPPSTASMPRLKSTPVWGSGI